MDASARKALWSGANAMSYADDVYVTSIFCCLTREQQTAIQRIALAEWKPIGESANEIVARLAHSRVLDTDWITEYLAYHGKPWDVSTTK